MEHLIECFDKANRIKLLNALKAQPAQTDVTKLNIEILNSIIYGKQNK